MQKAEANNNIFVTGESQPTASKKLSIIALKYFPTIGKAGSWFVS